MNTEERQMSNSIDMDCQRFPGCDGCKWIEICLLSCIAEKGGYVDECEKYESE